MPRFTKLGPSRLGLAVARARGEAEGVGTHPQVKRKSGLWRWRPPSRVLACRGPAALLAGPRSQSRGPVSLECLVWDGGLAAPLFDRHSWAVISTGASTCGVGERPDLRVRPCAPGHGGGFGPPGLLLRWRLRSTSSSYASQQYSIHLRDPATLSNSDGAQQERDTSGAYFITETCAPSVSRPVLETGSPCFRRAVAFQPG